ncbi:MAG: argininosuccinate lyase [Verrucomicrobiales bacterium]
MWTGRFAMPTDQALVAYSESVSFDQRLAPFDIQGSKVHALLLEEAGVLSIEEREAIHKGLDELLVEIEAGRFLWRIEREDVHMNIEAALTERIGDAGAKLHTARSRNDQVALDFRLYCRALGQRVQEVLSTLQASLVRLGKRSEGIAIPGYTHLQRAQPVLVAHHLLAYVEMFERDFQRTRDALVRVNVYPLGSGALAGSTIVLNRKRGAELLGFDQVSENSMDAISDRDFVAELLFVLALIGTHVSRLAEDIILWASAEFHLLELSDAFTTGSSLMPQKKNPDVAELARGKTGRLYGNLIGLLTVLKGLPMTYNRDLQEDKESLFDSEDTVLRTLQLIAAMLDQAKFLAGSAERMVEDANLLATDLADELVRQGVPFRQAHEAVGRVVARAQELGISLRELSPEEYHAIHSKFPGRPADLLSVEASLKARRAQGAPAPELVAERLEVWESLLADRI